MARLPIPLIDFEPFRSGQDESTRKSTARQIDNAFQKYGLLYLKNHGLPQEKVDEAFERAKEFFGLPNETKELVEQLEGSGVDRGWAHVRHEQISLFKHSGKPTVDYRETFDVGSPQGELKPNKWLSEKKLPGFRAFFEAFFLDCHKLVLRVLDSLAMAMDLEAHGVNLSSTHSGAMAQLRLQHYPPLSTSWLGNQPHVRMSKHSDYGTLTLLFQDEIGGLEIEDLNEPGIYRRIEPIRGTVIINVGDLLERWSNGRWLAAPHRVVVPPTTRTQINGESEANSINASSGRQDAMLPGRHSIPFFAFPDADVTIEALPGTFSESNPKKYDPIQIWERFSERPESSKKSDTKNPRVKPT